MKKILTLTTATILMFGFIGRAADVGKNPTNRDFSDRFKVYVDVACDDESTKAAVESYIKRELRALRDVDIMTKRDATYFLGIVVLEDRLTDGRKVGYTIAYCYYSRVARPPRLDHISGQTDEVRDYLRLVESFAVLPPDLGLVAGPKDSLKWLCERVVVKFDTGLLELIRKQRRP